ncbi:MAG TPA: hypothetical protein VGQ83_17980 [Polyangia bacterium]
MKQPQRIAVYGKGGIGKSVVATSLSAVFAQGGGRVLHVGCDPKRDSAMRLIDRPAGSGSIRTVLEALGQNVRDVPPEQVLHRARLGITCCESGGPKPGVGCGGRGVARTLEYLDEKKIIQAGGYDYVLFDVLGDVVCGGFAAPLRQRFAEKVVVVVSEEPMALYAANNIARAIEVYHENGVVLAGLVANLRSPDADLGRLEQFAARLSTRVLATIPRDPLIGEAEVLHRTIVEHAPQSAAAGALRALAAAVVAVEPSTVGLPTPMDDEAFFGLLRLA